MAEPMRKTALITGASAGLGVEFAHQLAALGYDLILTARRKERLEALAQEITHQHGRACTVLPADLAEDAGIRAVEQRISSLENLEILVNNAGFGVKGDFAETPVEKQLAMIQVHVLATVRLTRAALPGMLRRRRGGVINVASIAAFTPYRNVTYTATKVYLVNFSEALQTELLGSGVRIQALCPGFTYTEFHDTPDLAGFKRSKIPAWLWLRAEKVVRNSLQGLWRGPVVCIPGWQYKLVALAARTPFTAGILRTGQQLLSRLAKPPDPKVKAA